MNNRKFINQIAHLYLKNIQEDVHGSNLGATADSSAGTGLTSKSVQPSMMIEPSYDTDVSAFDYLRNAIKDGNVEIQAVNEDEKTIALYNGYRTVVVRVLGFND